jgi:nicotinate-nucleotide--dimethylbenzimidazole phosphoribosyltransferase
LKRVFEIQHPSKAAQASARQYIDSLVKPIGSLGALEAYAIRLSGIFGTTRLPALKKAVAVFAADNGVWDEGITPVPQSVTAMQAVNMTKGITGVNVLASSAGADVFVYDMGIRGFSGHAGIIDRRVGNGTCNIVKGPAMDITQAVQAIAHGIDAAEALHSKGYRVVGCGEMGICNTTTAAAVVSVLTGAGVDDVVGRGAGITDAQLKRKRDVVRCAIDFNRPDADDVIGVLAALGGFDIAAMTGFYIGAAYKRMAVVIDGFVSAAAALAASRLNAATTAYMFASHRSPEPGFRAAMDELGLTPPLSMDMRLGEGSGCPLMFHILDAAAAIMRDMGTFGAAKIDASNLVDIRGNDSLELGE